jgi:hypothetical protein
MFSKSAGSFESPGRLLGADSVRQSGASEKSRRRKVDAEVELTINRMDEIFGASDQVDQPATFGVAYKYRSKNIKGPLAGAQSV